MKGKKVTKQVPKPTPKSTIKPTPKPTIKPIPKPISNVIKLENNTDDFDLKQDDIYFVKSDSCFFCKMMLPEWNKAKKENKNIKIYEIERKYLDKYPKISVYVESYPTLLRYHNNDFFEFNKERTVENLSKFLKI